MNDAQNRLWQALATVVVALVGCAVSKEYDALKNYGGIQSMLIDEDSPAISE